VVKFQDRDVCIVGVGLSDEYGFDLGKSPMRLQIEAFRNALADSGLKKTDIDGFATAMGSPTGVDYEEFTAVTGVDARWVEQAWAHGRWGTGLVINAELAVKAGLADVVVILNTVVRAKGYAKHLRALGSHHMDEGLRDTGGGHGEWSWSGFDTPGLSTALVARRYMERYGATSDDLARIAGGYRANSHLNPMAIMRNKTLTLEDYYTEPMIADPFRRCDFSLTNEGSTCILVTTEERARDLGKKPVRVSGAQSIRSNRDSYVMFSRPGLGVDFADEFPYTPEPVRAFEMAGVTTADIDGLYVYDSFCSNLWMILERYGYCAEGEAPAYIEKNGITVGNSKMPVNTNGGLMSEGHFSGYSHIIEMVRQLRGEAGPRQIPDAEVLHWATAWGDSLVLTA
jgi:acetyl-CoA acetyltransferase